MAGFVQYHTFYEIATAHLSGHHSLQKRFYWLKGFVVLWATTDDKHSF